MITPGGSGYFSRPSTSLDPRLFSGDEMLPAVRGWILKTLYSYWDHKYKHATSWSTVWAAGSGISYQWNADRSNGDLDILIGVDFPGFYRSNPEYVGLSEAELADIFNSDFHRELWPTTANWNGFEVTFYVNPNSTDIRDINPYAAYNVSAGEWTVRPPLLPEDPRSLYPKEYWDAVGAETKAAHGIIERYSMLSAQAQTMAPGTPGWTNSLHAQELVVSQAKALFDSIHVGRKAAFAPGGSGYGDYYNFRWQAHKEAGTVQALNDLARRHDTANEQYDEARYGTTLGSAHASLTAAALWNTPYRRP